MTSQSNMYKDNWTQPWPMGSEIYPKVHENPRAFFSSSSPIFLEPLAHGSSDWSLPRVDCINFGGCSFFDNSLNLECFLVQQLLRWLAPCFWTQILQGMAPILLPIPYMATHKQGNKETSNNQRPKKNEIKAKHLEFYQDKFSRIIQQLKK